MFDAVIFDCDGVLVDSEVLALQVELQSLSEVGLFYRESEFKARFMGMSDKAFFDALDADHVREFGKSLPDGFRDTCKARYRASWHRLTEVRDARATIGKISHPKAVASSSSVEGLERKLRQTELWDLFAPHVYSADHVTHAKPAPDLFLHAAQGLNVSPARCLVFEDSVNGVLAARAAGMTAWGFLGGGHMDDDSADRLVAAGAQRLIRNWADAGPALSVSRE